MNLIVHSASNKSRYHALNEDTFHVSENLIIVADGMGGESSGDVASKIAVETVIRLLSQDIIAGISDEKIPELLFSAISEADNAITAYINDHPDSIGMGTTILIGVVRGINEYIAWCGDSHCFVYNKGDIKSLTKDHSYVQELIDDKKITVEESYTHPDNNLITRYVGGGVETCRPEFIKYSIKDGDVLIFCSDGLSGYCMIDDIKDCIFQNGCTHDLPSQLLDLAFRHGSDDDITVVTAATEEQLPRRRSSLLGWLKQMTNSAT